MILSDNVLFYSEKCLLPRGETLRKFIESLPKEKYIFRRKYSKSSAALARKYVKDDSVGMILFK